MEILVSRGSAYKIAMDGGTNAAKRPNLSAPKFNNRMQMT
jgi:hypothetical protein